MPAPVSRSARAERGHGTSVYQEEHMGGWLAGRTEVRAEFVQHRNRSRLFVKIEVWTKHYPRAAADKH